MSRPDMLGRLLQYMQDAKARGETPHDTILREKMEWAHDDALSVRLKELGNAALKQGDYRQAYVYYTACVSATGHEDVYWLNRAQCCLLMKAYKEAERDATIALERGVGNPSIKAYYRRGRARRYLGKLREAEADIQVVLGKHPNDPNALAERAEIQKLGAMSSAEREAWLEGNGGVDRALPDVTEEELDKLARERRQREAPHVPPQLPPGYPPQYWEALMRG